VKYENQAGWKNKSKQQLMYWFIPIRTVVLVRKWYSKS
jgi:hypothetical protein